MAAKVAGMGLRKTARCIVKSLRLVLANDCPKFAVATLWVLVPLPNFFRHDVGDMVDPFQGEPGVLEERLRLKRETKHAVTCAGEEKDT